jgi:hypothetical protein
LRRDCLNGTGEDVWSEHDRNAGVQIGERGSVENRLAALAEKEGVEHKAGAQGFGDKVFTFDTEEVSGMSGFGAEGGAQGFDPGVGFARDGG